MSNTVEFYISTPWRKEMAELRETRVEMQLRFSLPGMIQKLKSPFSFIRMEGLTDTITFLRTASPQELCCYCELCISEPSMNVVTVCVDHVLGPNANVNVQTSVQPPEVLLALRILEGSFLLDKRMGDMFAQLRMMEILKSTFDSSQLNCRLQAVSTVFAAVMHSEQALKHVSQRGFDRLVAMLKSTRTPTALRFKIMEFLSSCTTKLSYQSGRVHVTRLITHLLGGSLVRLMESSTANPEAFLNQLDRLGRAI